MKSRTTPQCGRALNPKDYHLSGLAFSAYDLNVLQIMRLYMQSVSHPPSMAWMAAITGADTAFGATYGPQIAARTLDALQRVRLARKSVFHFNSPTCPCCCQIVTEHERRFMVAMEYSQSGALGQAKMELIMLCEGNDVRPALNALERLNHVIADFHDSGSSPTRCNGNIVQRLG